MATTDPFNLAPGLVKYYSSQATAMLSQYKNINRLLGPTKHWTHPGEFCEVLLRDFFRKFFPPQYSIDKGFVFGRTMLGDEDIHSPEIDIPIHDQSVCAPMFKMGHLVIVQAQAVRAMIQIKRKLTRKQMKNGAQNIARARQHFIKVIRSETGTEPPPVIFSAVVGFGHEAVKAEEYKALLLELYNEYKAYDVPGKMPTGMYVLPNFIGSLTGTFVSLAGAYNLQNPQYVFGASHHGSGQDKVNVMIQALLWQCGHLIHNYNHPGPLQPHCFPSDMATSDFHLIREPPTESKGAADAMH
jgi:hypothetical protein